MVPDYLGLNANQVDFKAYFEKKRQNYVFIAQFTKKGHEFYLN